MGNTSSGSQKETYVNCNVTMESRGGGANQVHADK